MSLFIILGCVIAGIILLVLVVWVVIVIAIALNAYKLRAAVLDNIAATDPFDRLSIRREVQGRHYARR